MEPRRRGGEACRNRAGFRTSHPRTGRCYLHGGATPIKHGLYSTVVHEQLRAKIALAESVSPLDQAMQALSLQSALAIEYVNRFQPGVPLTGKDITLLSEVLEKISRMAERITRMRQMEAMTVAEGVAILEGFARLVETYIDDPAKLEAFGKDIAEYMRTLAEGKVGMFEGGQGRKELPSP